MEIPNGHHQAMATHQLEETLLCPGKTQQQQERKIKSHPKQALKCPRCASINTKFCYYNNYSLTQPRYFCKGCRRYWTQGGSLRNVPIGGGCRKNKRSSSSSSKKQEPNPIVTNTNPIFPPNLIAPPLSYEPSDLTLAFASLQKQPPAATAPKHPRQIDSLNNHDHNLLLEHANTEPIPTATSDFLDILRNGFVDTTCTSGFNSVYHSFGMNGNAEVGGVNVGGEEGVISSVSGLGGAAGNTMTSEESCKDLVEGDTKMLMGLPWQVAGGDENIAVDSGRDYWTTVGSSWHGLVNSSLM